MSTPSMDSRLRGNDGSRVTGVQLERALSRKNKQKRSHAMSIVEVKVPDIGDFKEVEVIELMVKPGDTIKVDQSLIMVESDKASMEIPSSHAGVVKELRVKVGDKVAEGSLLLILEASDAGSA